MKKLGTVKLSALITIAVVLIFSAFQIRSGYDMFDATRGMGTAAFWLGILALIIGLILCIIPQSRKAGQGMLIGGGLLLLIGFSLCTGGFGIFN